MPDKLISFEADIIAIAHLCMQTNCIHQENCPFARGSQEKWKPRFRVEVGKIGSETGFVVKCLTAQAYSNFDVFKGQWNKMREYAHDALAILQVFQIDDHVTTIRALIEHPEILSALRAADMFTVVDNDGNTFSMSIFEIMSEGVVNRNWGDN